MKDLINPWVIAGAVLIAALLLAASFLAAGQLTPLPTSQYQGGAVLTIIPMPTATRTPVPTWTSMPVISPTPEPLVGIQVGGFVQISGTGGEGLRLRQAPSLSGEIVYVGVEGEIFQVLGGPEEQDGYLWWQLVAPLNETLQGWAASSFLIPAQGP